VINLAAFVIIVTFGLPVLGLMALLALSLVCAPFMAVAWACKEFTMWVDSYFKGGH
jgi:hypothetical protein